MARVFARLLAGALSISSMALGGSKEDETLTKAAKVLKEMIDKKAVPPGLLFKANCLLVLPEVKKFGFGIGGSGGRGAMSCRKGKSFSGPWSAPAMYSIGGVSVGLQVGGSSTDYVLLVMGPTGVDALLKGKTKLGQDATVAAGPSGATTANVGGGDILSYGNASGLFAGMSLGGATIEPDESANRSLYGKQISPREVLDSAIEPPAAAEPLISLLNSKVANRGK